MEVSASASAIVQQNSDPKSRSTCNQPSFCTAAAPQAASLNPGKLSDSGQGCVPYTLELFAGSCKLSKCLKLHGFVALGIDHKKCKNRVGPCVIMDLANESSRKFLKQHVKKGTTFFIPMAPPCGTASRARDKPIPFRLRRLGVPQPKPLRSSRYPMGLPGLSGRDWQRVQQANFCYATAAEIFRMAHEQQVFVFIENPTGSYMWDVPCIAELFDLEGVYFTTFHVCMHGGDRDKRTSLLHNCPWLKQLELRCDRSHNHKKWSVSRTLDGRWQYDTASEAEYPLLLCQRIAVLISKAAIHYGHPVSVEPKGLTQPNKASTPWKVSAARQPRGRRLQNLLPEDGQVVTCVVNHPQDVSKLQSVKSRSSEPFQLGHQQFPKGTRLINLLPSALDGEQVEDHGDWQHVQSWVATLGIPMTPEEAVRRATLLNHPFDEALQAPDHVLRAMFQIVTCGSDSMHNERVNRLKWLKQRAIQLQPLEEEMHGKLERKVAEILSSKRLLLFEEVLTAIKYPDVNLVEDIKRGMAITGDLECTSCFAPEFKPAQMSQEDLWRVSKFAQKEVEGRVPAHVKRRFVEGTSGTVDVSREVWESTLKEAERGWLGGPLQRGAVAAEVGSLWTPSRRFGVVQGGKVRNIDDLSEFSVNQCYGTSEKLDLGGVDEVVSLAVAWAKILCQPGDDVVVRLSTGEVLQGQKCEEFRKPGVKLRGRCLDLKAAYKQLALRPSDRPNAVLAVFDPDADKIKYFVSYVLPFGATGSVMNFNRVARALRDVMQKFFMLPVVNYFDDYPHVDVPQLAVRSQVVMEEVLKTLGWQVAEEPKKRLPPSEVFVVLGVQVDLTESHLGFVKVCNKPERVLEVEEVRKEVESSRQFPPSTAARLYGRLNFAEAQCSGRWLVPVMEPIKQSAHANGSVKVVTRDLQESLQLVIALLSTAPPRSIDAISKEPPCVVFTDGAFESGIASCGIVISSPRLSKPLVLGFVVPQGVMDEWMSYGLEQVITQAEMLPIVVVKSQFRRVVSSTRTLFFVDNDGVKEAFVAGTIRSPASRKMLTEAMILDSQSNSLSWYARIPSPSNIADAPSRFQWEELRFLGDFDIVDPVIDYKEWGKLRVVP